MPKDFMIGGQTVNAKLVPNVMIAISLEGYKDAEHRKYLAKVIEKKLIKQGIEKSKINMLFPVHSLVMVRDLGKMEKVEAPLQEVANEIPTQEDLKTLITLSSRQQEDQAAGAQDAVLTRQVMPFVKVVEQFLQENGVMELTEEQREALTAKLKIVQQHSI